MKIERVGRGGIGVLEEIEVCPTHQPRVKKAMLA